MIIGHFAFRRRWLSNFYYCHVEYKGRVYQSVEHAYQALKASNRHDHDWVAAAEGAGEARLRGQWVTKRGSFDNYKRRLMLKLLWSKFHHNLHLRKKLLATWPHELVHGNMHEDKYWGVSRRTGEGDNHLGKLLMLLRDAIREGTDDRIPMLGVKNMQAVKEWRHRTRKMIDEHNAKFVVKPLPKLTHEQTLNYYPSTIKRRDARMGVAAQSRRAKETWPARKWDEEFYRKMRLEMFGPQERLDPKRFKK